MIPHGGQLLAAARRYGIEPRQWLDLSTGINPNGYPVPRLPPECWQRLPEADDGLIEAACRYYGCGHLLPVAGSQAAIQLLPWLRPPGAVGVLTPAYEEHLLAWKRAGHKVYPLLATAIEPTLDNLNTLVIINPNNPTGHRFAMQTLRNWHSWLTQRGGWLVVDEAFIDSTPQDSLREYTSRPGLILLRSLGKFFGLAGIRCGFVLADQALLDRLQDRLGPWPVSGPARAVAKQALLDRGWQETTRERLLRDSHRLAQLLCAHQLPPSGGTDLFQWIETLQAREVHERLAQRGILTRLFEDPPSLRFGLPGEKEEWERLAEALRSLIPSCNQR